MDQRVEVEGRPVDPVGLLPLGYGHFTAMQVRGGRVRGLDLHLARLAAANRELFDRDLDAPRLRGQIRQAVGVDGDGSVRVHLVQRDDGGVSTVVSVRPPGEMAPGRQKLLPVGYQRPAAHLKHTGGFGQEYFRRLAARRGFDEALLTAPDGTVAEGGITNVGGWDGAAVVWPDAPQLAGVTMLLLDRELAARGVPVRRRRLTVAGLSGLDTVFVTNSRGIAAVDRIGAAPVPVDEALMGRLHEAYDAVAWDPI